MRCEHQWTVRRLKFALAPLCALLALGIGVSKAEAAVNSINLHADHVAYFAATFIITGDGNVRLRLTDGTVIRGETFAMDLRLNRFLVAGDVHVDRGDVHLSGAAFSDFLDFNRAYFIPILQEPDRWTYLNDDLRNPIRGRVMPGDAFALPDTTRSRAYVLAKSAFIIPKTNIQFTPARVATGFVYAPFPAYNLNFSSNPNFSQNAFAGAYLDVPIPLEGNAHNLFAAHVRYDSVNHVYLSFDEHIVYGLDYLVLSLNPATKDEKQYNTIANYRISPALQIHDFTQVQNFQSGFGMRVASAQFTSLQFTAALRRSFVTATGNFYNNSILPGAYYALQEDHPTNASLSWTGYQNQVFKTPLHFLLQSGLTYAHDGLNFDGVQYGVGTFLGTPYTTLVEKYGQLELFTPSVKVRQNVYANAVFVKNRQYYSLPHFIDATTLTESLSYLPPRGKTAYVTSYTISNTGDFAGARQTQYYPVTIPYNTFTNQYDYGFAAFRGFGTSRALTGSLVYTPNPDFTFNLAIQRNKDFPGPVPGVYGNPPYIASGDLRIRLARQLSMDIARAYYFNFGNARWSPSFNIQFAP